MREAAPRTSAGHQGLSMMMTPITVATVPSMIAARTMSRIFSRSW